MNKCNKHIKCETCARRFCDIYCKCAECIDGDNYIVDDIDSLYPKTMFTDEVRAYMVHDIDVTREIFKSFVNRQFGIRAVPSIKNVIFNDPATIVFWADGTKTVVKTQNDDEFDPEKGIAMAISKKALGNKGSYFNDIKKWADKYHGEQISKSPLEKLGESLRGFKIPRIPMLHFEPQFTATFDAKTHKLTDKKGEKKQ